MKTRSHSDAKPRSFKPGSNARRRGLGAAKQNREVADEIGGAIDHDA
jgi:hypothetical protein